MRERDVLIAIRDAYGAIPAQPVPAEDIVPEPVQLEERRVELRKPTASEKLAVGYKGPALGDADHAPMTVLSEVLFGGRASRLHRSLVTERELATEIRGWVSTFRDPGLFECWITARGAHTAPEIVPVLDEAFARVRAEVVSDDELARAKARLELESLQHLETASGKAEQIGFFEMVLGDPEQAFRRVEATRRVTAGDVRRVARRYLVDSSRTVLRVLPDRGAGATGVPGEAEAAQ
jgi:zinc protease